MLLDKHERKYKKFIALQKEYNDILKAERSLPWTEVKPYQDGWFIHIEFRDEVKRRDDYPQLKAVLDLVARKGRTKNPKLVNILRNIKRIDQMYKWFYSRNRWELHTINCDSYIDHHYYSGSGRYGDSSPSLGRVKPEDYDKLHPSSKKWMYKVVDTKYNYTNEYYRSNIPHHFFKVKVRPALVTHEQGIDPQLMKRKAEVSAEMETLGRDFWTKEWNGWYHFINRRRRVHDRASLRKILKGEKDDFEYIRKNKHYD